jgi:hypothetical protein
LWTKNTWPPRAISVRIARTSTAESNFTTFVWIASRSFGGVSITDMSRMPTSDMFNVRGIGVAVIVRTSDLLAHLLDALLVRHAEALLFVDDEQAEVLEVDVLREQAMRADDHVEAAGGERFQRFLDLLLRCGSG